MEKQKETSIYKNSNSYGTVVVHNPSENVSVFSSRSYEQFKFEDVNRPVMPKHVADLKKSIIEHGYFIHAPILVKKTAANVFTIINGQHRFTACRELNEPIRFIIIDNSESTSDIIRITNSVARSWSEENFLNHFCSLGLEPYLSQSLCH